MIALLVLLPSACGVSHGPVADTRPFLAVDGLVTGVYVRGGWRAAPSRFGEGTGPIALRVVGCGRIGGAVKVLGVDPAMRDDDGEVDGVPKLWTRDDGASVQKVLVWGLNPKIPRAVGPAGARTVGAWVRSFLRTKGYRDAEPRVLHAFVADLDGTGASETLVEVASRPGLGRNSDWAASDYSAVLLRAGGRVIALEYSGKGNPTGCENRLRAIADLDGDGAMEVVTSWAYYEGAGAALLRFGRGKVRRLAQVGEGE